MAMLFRIVLIVFSVTLNSILGAELTQTVDELTKLKAWKLAENNFQLELIQRTPQQTRSFFQARGFSVDIANDIATQCVFQTIVRNTEGENVSDSISVSLKKWRIKKAGASDEAPIKLKEVWDKEWKEGDISNSARVAFRWATFPTEQTFQPGGDYNWGMISIGLKPDTLFDLHVFWKQDGVPKDAWIKNIQCPADKPE
jgi:hypothetical protein